ncbi:hypothetical protein BN2476_850062 [Paraburkholderia piptadeniae]|uniref:Uncharacterized protein n=1 Tax=Paraburkholderia piptadeniae TaxID=1701573 RepID=A0A1N7ST31_9BURK|nr:hypothetical protein BN2476_850062 [Paraburkholderia piptadeniae]
MHHEPAFDRIDGTLDGLCELRESPCAKTLCNVALQRKYALELARQMMMVFVRPAVVSGMIGRRLARQIARPQREHRDTADDADRNRDHARPDLAIQVVQRTMDRQPDAPKRDEDRKRGEDDSQLHAHHDVLLELALAGAIIDSPSAARGANACHLRSLHFCAGRQAKDALCVLL